VSLLSIQIYLITFFCHKIPSPNYLINPGYI